MRNFLIKMIMLIFVLTHQVFATNETNEKLERNVNINEKLERNVNIFNTYDANKKGHWGAFLLNLLLLPGIGTGIGSFVQGDYSGGGYVLGFTLLGTLLSGVGAGTILTTPTENKARKITGTVILGIGAGMIGISYITSLIIPFTFAKKHNEDLKKSLSTNLSGFEPSLDIGLHGLQISLKKSY